MNPPSVRLGRGTGPATGARLAALVGLAAAASCTAPWPEEDLGGGAAAVRVSEREPAAVRGDAITSSLAYVGARTGALGLTDRDDFEVLSVARGPGELRTVRLRQRHEGWPVWGADVAVQVSADEVLGLSGALAPALAPARIDLPPRLRIDRAQAVKIGKMVHASEQGVASLEYARERAELVVFPDGSGAARLAWHVELFAEQQGDAGPSRPHRILDAETGETLMAHDAIAAIARGSGPGGNARVDRFWHDALEVAASCGDYRMQTPRLKTLDMGGRSSGAGSVVEGPLDCVGDRAANDAHGFAAITLDMLAAWMGRDSIDDAGGVIRSRVGYGDGYANAFWDGEQVSYGDGGSAFYPLSGDATVVAHELHHGFTEHHANLIFKGQAGALNESFSDVAGVAVAFFLDGRLSTEPGFRVGADVMREPGGVLRDLCDPRRDGRSIDHADDHATGMFIHAASGVPNKAFCLAARRLSASPGRDGGGATRAGVRRAAHAWFEANAGYWTQTTDFEQGCRGVVDAAAALGYAPAELDAIADSWADVGVFCHGP